MRTLFRHDYITRKALDGENPSIVKRWVRHRTFAMTDRYFGIAASKLAAVRPKHSVLEGIVPLAPGKRGRPSAESRLDARRLTLDAVGRAAVARPRSPRLAPAAGGAEMAVRDRSA